MIFGTKKGSFDGKDPFLFVQFFKFLDYPI